MAFAGRRREGREGVTGAAGGATATCSGLPITRQGQRQSAKGDKEEGCGTEGGHFSVGMSPPRSM